MTHEIVNDADAFRSSLIGALRSRAGEDTRGLEDLEVLERCKGVSSAGEARELLRQLPEGHFGRQVVLASPRIAIIRWDADGVFDDLTHLSQFLFSAMRSERRSILFNLNEMTSERASLIFELPIFDDELYQRWILDAALWWTNDSQGLISVERIGAAFNSLGIALFEEFVEKTEEGVRRFARLLSTSPSTLRIRSPATDLLDYWRSADRDELRSDYKLSNWSEVRRLIGIGCLNGDRLGTLWRQMSRQEALGSSDIAIRCAAYSWSELTPEDMELGCKKDGKTFFLYAIENPMVLRHRERSEYLRHMIEARVGK